MDKRSFKRRAAAGVIAIVLALVATDGVAGGSQVKRVGNLYQWVDTNGRVIYGDSPPTVSESRQVDSRSKAGVQRSFPARRESQEQASVVVPKPAAKPSAAASLNAEQLAALARLDPDLAHADSVVSGDSSIAVSAEPKAVASSVTIANNSSSVSLGLTTATVIDVAHSEPQLIETELSEKELVRLRRRSLAIGERRFLERLKGFQTGSGISE